MAFNKIADTGDRTWLEFDQDTDKLRVVQEYNSCIELNQYQARWLLSQLMLMADPLPPISGDSNEVV
jgi:hypothetical protein